MQVKSGFTGIFSALSKLTTCHLHLISEILPYADSKSKAYYWLYRNQ